MRSRITREDLNEGLNNIELDIVEQYVSDTDSFKGSQKRRFRRRLTVLVAAVLILSVAIIPTLMIFMNRSDAVEDPKTPHLDVGEQVGREMLQFPAPNIYGSQGLFKGTSSVEADLAPMQGIFVHAKWKETLSDTYFFLDDWDQTRYCVLRMKTIEVLSGGEMVNDFYYIIPVEYKTDFSIYHTFTLKMVQYSLEDTILYNATEGCAEKMDKAIFGYYASLSPDSFKAFYKSGDLDKRIWRSNDAWTKKTEGEYGYDYYDESYTLEKEKSSANKLSCFDYSAVKFKDLRNDFRKKVKDMRSVKSGLVIQSMTDDRPVPFRTVEYRRFLNGYTTNESIRLFRKTYITFGEDKIMFGEDKIEESNAKFTREDSEHLPDLHTAVDSIKEAVNSGAITAPHIATYPHMELCEHGVFAWYAKTADGVLGIVRVNWSYIDRGCKSLYNNYYDDDAYFLVDQNGLYEPITRDDLLLKLEGYECDYIYTGRYDSFGKERNIAVCF